MFTDPVKNLKAFGLRENDIVADLGAGTGFYSMAAAKMVPNGKVYAIEVQKDFLTAVKNKAKEAHLDNLETLWGNIEKIGGTKIGDDVVDAVIVSNVLFQVEDKRKFIDETKRILKSGGRVLLIDWSEASAFAKASADKSPLGIVTENKAKEMFEEKGFIWDRKIDAGEHHYGMILRKATQ